MKIAALPKVHQAVDTVNEGDRSSTGRFVSEGSALTLHPGLQFHLAARAFFFSRPGLCAWHLSVGVCLFFIIFLDSLPPGETDQVPCVGQFLIRDAAGNRVEDTRPRRGLVHAKVVPVKKVVGRRLVQTVGGPGLCGGPGLSAWHQKYPADDKVHNHPADVVEKFADRHRARFVGLLHHRMLAVGLQCRTRRRPHKVGTPNPGIPKLTEHHTDIPAHVF